MKLISFLFLSSLLITSAFANSEVEYSEFEVTVALKALDYADPISSNNEYKIGLSLTDAKTRNNLGSLIGSTSANIKTPFANYIRIKRGETASVTSTILLPTKTIHSLKFSVAAVEADFTLAIPGPCCIIVNDDDTVIFEKFSLVDQVHSLVSDDGVTEVDVTIKRVSQGSMELKTLKDKQKDLFIEESGVRFFDSKMLNLYNLILETI
jgi:hypothetical protein